MDGYVGFAIEYPVGSASIKIWALLRKEYELPLL